MCTNGRDVTGRAVGKDMINLGTISSYKLSTSQRCEEAFIKSNTHSVCINKGGIFQKKGTEPHYGLGWSEIMLGIFFATLSEDHW